MRLQVALVVGLVVGMAVVAASHSARVVSSAPVVEAPAVRTTALVEEAPWVSRR